MIDKTRQELLDLHACHVMGTYFPSELLLVRGQGARLWEADGREFLDFAAGISVCNLGHCHPRVTAAIARQAGELVHVSNLFMNPNQPILASLVAGHSFGGRVFFCNSGAEANEGMIKFARKWGHEAGRHEIVCMDDSFHGRTLATLAATGRAKYRKGFQPDVEGFVHVPFNDIEALAKACGERTCAVLLEPVQGEGGVVPAELDYLRAVRQFCDDRQLLLLIDEVQCGMGRTGKYFAYQHYGIEPDAMSMAKALGNGFPLGALEVQQRHAAVLSPGTHATTFGGSALACAAGIAVFEAMEAENVLANVDAVGAYLRAALDKMRNTHPCIGLVRGLGLMIGVLLDPQLVEVATVVAAARAQGLLVLSAGENVLRLLPPLTIGTAEVDQAVTILDRVLP